MHRVLTIDNSRAVRMLVAKQARELRCEVDEAEDGAAGLVKLEAQRYSMVVLDLTMPVLDGPGMLAAMRARGDQTPVLVLTSESKRSVVAGLLKLGITDYILKPFKSEELQSKMLKILGGTRGDPTQVDSASGDSAQATSPEPTGGKPATDI